jgi:hypothetical protein
VAKYDKVIPPGQEGKIHMVIEGKRVHGKFSKSATIRSNDPEHPTMSVSIAGNITPYISVTPNARVFLQGHYGEPVKKSLTLKSNEDDLDFKITKIESNLDDKITYDFEPNENGKLWTVNVYKNPKLGRMSTYGSLTVHTNSENSPTKMVQVQVITKGAITVQPQHVNFGTVHSGNSADRAAPVTRNVVVLKLNGDFSIEDLAFSTDEFDGEIEAVEPGKRYNVKVTFTPPEEVAKQRSKTHVGEMTILTDDPKEPELKVRLVARSK